MNRSPITRLGISFLTVSAAFFVFQDDSYSGIRMAGDHIRSGWFGIVVGTLAVALAWRGVLDASRWPAGPARVALVALVASAVGVGATAYPGYFATFRTHFEAAYRAILFVVVVFDVVALAYWVRMGGRGRGSERAWEAVSSFGASARERWGVTALLASSPVLAATLVGWVAGDPPGWLQVALASGVSGAIAVFGMAGLARFGGLRPVVREITAAVAVILGVVVGMFVADIVGGDVFSVETEAGSTLLRLELPWRLLLGMLLGFGAVRGVLWVSDGFAQAEATSEE